MYTNGNEFILNNILYVGYYNLYREKYYTELQYIFGISKPLTKIVDQNDPILKYISLNSNYYNYIKKLDFVSSNYILDIDSILLLIIYRYFVYSIVLKKYYEVNLKTFSKSSDLYYVKYNTSWNISSYSLTQSLSDYKKNIAIKYNKLQIRKLKLKGFTLNISPVLYIKQVKYLNVLYPTNVNLSLVNNIALYKLLTNKNFRVCNSVSSSYSILNSHYFDNNELGRICLGRGNTINNNIKLKQFIIILFKGFTIQLIKLQLSKIFNELSISILKYYVSNSDNICVYINIDGYLLSYEKVIDENKSITVFSLGFYTTYNLYNTYINTDLLISSNDINNLINNFINNTNPTILSNVLFELILLDNYGKVNKLEVSYNLNTDFYSKYNLINYINKLVIGDYENRYIIKQLRYL